jgi:Fur family transcriptional regulator, ferric uptake regulator
MLLENDFPMSEYQDLKTAGLKVTQQRITILSIFRSSKTRHLNAEEVHQQLMAQQSDIGLATVYRALDQLEDAGLLRRNSFTPSKAVVFELNENRHHDHLICLGCGRTDEFNDPKIERQQKVIVDSFGYSLSDHQLALYGYCASCTSTQSKVAG